MILTGKCKEDFIKTKIGNEINLFESMLPIYKNALLIEWFDTISYENSTLWEYCFEHVYSNNIKSFKEIVIKSIKKANEIYNSN